MKPFATAAVKDLRRLLESLSLPFPAMVDQAEQELHAAAAIYVQSRPLVNTTGGRHKLPIAQARAAMLDLHKKLAAAHRAATNLPPNTFGAFRGASRPPLGTLTRRIARLMESVGGAYRVLKSAPDKEKDAARAGLAFEVALIIRDTLRVKPARTRLQAFTATSKPRTAAYARVLSATLAVAGTPNVDLGAVMDAGLRLLSDPDLPHNL